MANTYSTGTLEVTNGQKLAKLTGGSAISINMKPGDLIKAGDGSLNAIAAINTGVTPHEITFATEFDGTTSGSVAYFTTHMPAGWGDVIALNEHVADEIRAIGIGILTMDTLQTALDNANAAVATVQAILDDAEAVETTVAQHLADTVQAKDDAQAAEAAASGHATTADDRATASDNSATAAAQTKADMDAAIALLGLPGTHVASNYLRRKTDNTAMEYRTPSQVKSDIGLGNVDNTSDANKPVSTAQQSALDLKANRASPAFSGIPTAPTAPQETDNNQIATTAFVRAVVSALVDAAPGTLDTLNELAEALGNDPEFATTISNQIAEKLSTTTFDAWVTSTFDTHTHDADDITDATATGKAVLRAANAVAARVALELYSVAEVNNLLDDKLNASSYTAADVLAKLITVDGPGSGIDADKLDGLNSTDFLQTSYTATVDAALATKMNANITSLTLSLISSADFRLNGTARWHSSSAKSGGLLGTMLGAWSDAFQFMPVLSLEYYDGTNWVDYSEKLEEAKNLFDGIAETSLNLSATRNHWRVVIQAEAWHNGGIFQAYQEYTSEGGGHTFNLKVENCATQDFAAGVNTLINETGANDNYFYARAMDAGNADRYYRITIETTQPGSSKWVWLRCMTNRLTYGAFLGLPFDWRYDKVLRTSGVRVNGDDVWHEGNFDPAGKSNVGHQHAITDVTDLDTTLDAKADKGLLSGGTEVVLTANATITSTSNGKVVVGNSATPITFTLDTPANLGNKFLALISNVNEGDLTVAGSFDSGDTSLVLREGQSMAVTSNGTTHRLLLRGGGSDSSGATIPVRIQKVGDGGATYDIGHAIPNEDAMMVFVGGVPQGTDKYTIAGTSITFESNVTSGEKIEVFLIKSLSSILGVNPVYKKTAGTGSTGPFTLVREPHTFEAVDIYVGGILQPKDGLAYTIAGNQITFSEAIPSQTYWEELHLQPVAIGTPSDETVGATQIKGSDAEAIRDKLGLGSDNISANISSVDFTGNGTVGPYTLSATPVSKEAVLELIVGGYPQATSAIASVSGNTITMTEAIPNGVACSAKVITQVAIGTPSDETVGAAQIKASDAEAIREKLGYGDGNHVGSTVFSLTGFVFPGYLELDGSTFNQATFPDLYAYLGNSNVLPNFTDRVPRHAGPLAGAAGTTQDDATRVGIDGLNVSGSSSNNTGGGLAAHDPGVTYMGVGAISPSPSYKATATKIDISTVLDLRYGRGSETRVKAYVGKWLIKAASEPVNAGTVDVLSLATDVQGKVNKSDIVGTLTSAGNGRVIERGSNANGEYVKFADGTMICTKDYANTGLTWSAAVNIYRSATITPGAMPASFIAAPILSVSGTDDSGHGWPVIATYHSSSSWGLFAMAREASGNTGFKLRLTAIGRWF